MVNLPPFPAKHRGDAPIAIAAVLSRQLDHTLDQSRLVIGYNQTTDEIIYTDSWGPGHEFKRMSAANAYTATMHLITLKPSQ